MLDMKQVRKDRKAIEEKLRTKVPDCSLDRVCELDDELRRLKPHVEQLKATRNNLSKQIGEKKRLNQPADDLLAQTAQMADEIHTTDTRVTELERQLHHELATLPNLPMDGIKVSHDPKENEFVRDFGQKPTFAFTPKHHLELNEQLYLFDFKRAAKISGSGWPAYRGWGARLEWALIQYMISVHIRKGFEFWLPPHLVREPTAFASGQLPKFTHQQFAVDDDDYLLYLIPTAEVSLNGLHMGEIIPESALPLKYCAYTPCFRREAGAAGEKERGLIRMHQFNKVEMFLFCTPEQSQGCFDLMLESAEEILQGLGLHYRVMRLVTGDMSFAAAQTIDVEVYLPGQERYYEVSSVSNCTDYQARRSDTRYRSAEEDKLQFVHTLNGSGLATSRLLVAILENFQHEDGSIDLPAVLKPYLGIDKLIPEARTWS